MNEFYSVIKLIVIDFQPTDGPSQCFHHAFGLRSVRPAGDGLKGGIFTKCIESLVKLHIGVLGSGLVNDRFHIVEPDFSRHAACVIESIVHALEQRILMPVKRERDELFTGVTQHIYEYIKAKDFTVPAHEYHSL